MTTLKYIARNTEKGLYTLAVMNEHGFVNDVLATNADINTVTTIEKWFDMSKLADDEYLTWFYTHTDGKHFYKLTDEFGEGEWFKAAC